MAEVSVRRLSLDDGEAEGRLRRCYPHVAVGAFLLAVAAAGCGSAGSSTSSGVQPAGVRGAAAQVTSVGCSAGATSASPRAAVDSVGSCTFVLTDGRRFRCSGSAFAQSTPSPSMLEHAKGCVPLSGLVISASLRAVAGRIEVARACLTRKGLRVTGGPAFPPDRSSPSRPDGELIAGAVGAFIAVYTDPAKAQRLEPEAMQNAKRHGWQVERHGAVTVLWIHPPSSGARSTVGTCVFR
jgi:hypothetical protein